jgi:riboflavin synthase
VFTGIVEEVGDVVAAELRPEGARLRIRAPQLAPLARLGDSIAVSGCCLTVVERDGDVVAFDAVPETLSRTTLGGLEAGRRVNLEDSLRAGEPLGGHIVQGHVDGVGEVASREPEGDGARLAVRAPGDLRRFLVEKGSIAVAGVSLTVAALTEDGFEVALIPHTLAVTTLGELNPGDRVNLETDVLARHVERLLRPLVVD